MLPWFELPGSQPSGPLPTPWLHLGRAVPPRLPPSQPRNATSVSVTADLANARPSNGVAGAPPAMVIAAPERMVPLKSALVIVAAWATHHVTLHADAPLSRTTEKSVAVRAPVPMVPILNR